MSEIALMVATPLCGGAAGATIAGLFGVAAAALAALGAALVFALSTARTELRHRRWLREDGRRIDEARAEYNEVMNQFMTGDQTNPQGGPPFG